MATFCVPLLGEFSPLFCPLNKETGLLLLGIGFRFLYNIKRKSGDHALLPVLQTEVLRLPIIAERATTDPTPI